MPSARRAQPAKRWFASRWRCEHLRTRLPRIYEAPRSRKAHAAPRVLSEARRRQPLDLAKSRQQRHCPCPSPHGDRGRSGTQDLQRPRHPATVIRNLAEVLQADPTELIDNHTVLKAGSMEPGFPMRQSRILESVTRRYLAAIR